jgi:superfamily II DNA/RNA helicase
MTPQEKQVMMFSATLPKELRVVCKKFMQEVSHTHRHQIIHKTLCAPPTMGWANQCLNSLATAQFVWP